MSDQGQTTDARPDGFRPRRIRPKGWLAAAIARGEVRAPGAPDPGHPDLGPDGVVFEAPVAEAELTVRPVGGKE